MKRCLWCHEALHVNIGWYNILWPPNMTSLCHACEQQLEYLPEQVCRHCHRASSEVACFDCRRWQRFYDGNDPLDWNVSVFIYNDFLQEYMTKWKYRGDYILGDMLHEKIKNVYIKKVKPHTPKDAVVIPIPLSRERFKERAFNQAVQLASSLPLAIIPSLSRIHGEKQSKRTRHERIHAMNPFILKEKVQQTVILVDDIYTTGTTLRHAAALLRAAGAPRVCALTLARG